LSKYDKKQMWHTQLWLENFTEQHNWENRWGNKIKMSQKYTENV
jgi:hypothetical protein